LIEVTIIVLFLTFLTVFIILVIVVFISEADPLIFVIILSHQLLSITVVLWLGREMLLTSRNKNLVRVALPIELGDIEFNFGLGIAKFGLLDRLRLLVPGDAFPCFFDAKGLVGAWRCLQMLDVNLFPTTLLRLELLLVQFIVLVLQFAHFLNLV